MLVRESYSTEPLHALSVVERNREQAAPESEETDSEVAETEEFLDRAGEYATSADIPIDTHIGIDENDVTGIRRTVEENRITTLIVGWLSSQSFKRYLFGSTIDQILEQTTELVFVTKLEERLNVADRVVQVLPGRIASHPGFYEAVHAVKTVASPLGVPLTCLVIGDKTEEYERLVTNVEPELTVDIAAITDGRRLASSLNDRVNATDLVIAMSPREEARGWQPSLRNLPNHLETIDAENVVLAYPSEEDISDKRRFLRLT